MTAGGCQVKCFVAMGLFRGNSSTLGMACDVKKKIELVNFLEYCKSCSVLEAETTDHSCDHSCNVSITGTSELICVNGFHLPYCTTTIVKT